VEALYRKYRPKNFDQIIDQKQAKLVLQNAIAKDRVSHAYIFSGPRGTGKTSVARILAKALNCPNRSTYEPCCECESCLSIDRGTHPDVIELDAASNRGIDEIRRIRDAVGFRPMMGRYKVYIVDEFHMLTREAFNAFLKTLEEPPAGITFVLATTNLERVPSTIISRCQVIEFKNFTETDIFQNLMIVAKREGLNLEEDAAKLIAKRSAGGMRDALSYLEQIANFALEEVISLPLAEKALGLVPSEIVDQFINYIISGKISQIGRLLDTVFENGYDPAQLVALSVERIEERISQNATIELLQLAKDLLEISKELRFAENKKTICKILAMNLAAKNTESRQKVMQESKPVEEIVQPKEKKVDSNLSQIEELLQWLKDEKDMSIYVALAQSRITQKGHILDISFLPSQRFQYEYLREKLLELEYLFKTKMQKDVVVNLFIDEEREKRILQKLQENFPGRIRIEE